MTSFTEFMYDFHFRYLYYSDWGEKAKVMRCDLDGSNPSLVRGDLENPNGITLNRGKVHVVDSRAKSKESGNPVKGKLYSIDTSGIRRQEFDTLDLGVSQSQRRLFPKKVAGQLVLDL